MFGDIEFSLMAILANHPELVTLTNITAEMFEEREYSTIFKILKMTRKFDPVQFIEQGYSNFEMLIKILDGLVIESAYEENFRFFEKKIIGAYKTKELANLNYLLQIREIDYDEYKKRFQELAAIHESNAESYVITNEQLDDSLQDSISKINFKNFAKLGRLLNLESNDLITIAGASGFGKSALLLNLAADLIENQHCVQYYNLEMAHRKMLQRLIAIMTRIPIKKLLAKEYNHEQEQYVLESRNKLITSQMKVFSGSLTLERMRKLIIRNLQKGKQNVVFIDHVMLVGVGNRNYNTSEYNRVTYVMQELRKLCLEHNVLIFIASQIDRTSARENKITINSLKSSGEIENSSTHVILLYENLNLKDELDLRNPTKHVFLDVGKNRNNAVARISADFHLINQKFYEK